MRSNNLLTGIFSILPLCGLVAGCGGGGGDNPAQAAADPAAANVMTISVNGSLCSDATSANYINKPCVSVTVCNPDLSSCQTVNDVLLDTGSYGLRIFKQAIPGLTLPQIASGAGSLAGCVQFADGSSLWGPIQRAGVILGGEPAVQIPIQVIDASFGTVPTQCSNADPNPATAGYTGILGIGVFPQDCGPGCANSSDIGIYYRCVVTSCNGTTVPLEDQVQNPVAHLPQDDDGILVQLPSVPLGGVASTSGSLILGIGSRDNNTPSSVQVFPTDQQGDFTTVFDGINSTSFVDTGSNGLFFPRQDTTLLPLCPAPNSAWYCPPLTRALLATTMGAFGTPSAQVPFNIGNFSSLMNSSNKVFSDVGGPSTFGFDWGLPFFMGRGVFIGLDGKKSGLGTGPYIAY